MVRALLEEIDFFNGTHSTSLHAVEQSNEYRNALERKQQELENR